MLVTSGPGRSSAVNASLNMSVQTKSRPCGRVRVRKLRPAIRDIEMRLAVLDFDFLLRAMAWCHGAGRRFSKHGAFWRKYCSGS